jgi:transcriptional regulator of met regulon
MSGKIRLTDLAQRMESVPEGTGQAEGRLDELAASRPKNFKGPVVRLTVAIPQEMQQALSREVDRRAKQGLEGASESAVLGEALAEFFKL